MRSQKIVNAVLLISVFCLGIVLTATPSFAFTCGTDIITDADGNTYKTVSIGEQCWMATNMVTTKYPNDTAITKGPATHGGGGWITDQNYYSCPPNSGNNGQDCNAAYPRGADATPAGGATGTGEEYGLLYQWSAAMNGAVSCNGTRLGSPACSAPVQGICPRGWHIPAHYEFTALEHEVCDSGSCSKDFPYDTSTTGWRGTDEGTRLKDGGSSNFNGLLAGHRFTLSNYNNRGAYMFLWSSTEAGGNAWRRYLHSGHATVYRNTFNKAYGFSVRCIRD